MNSEAMVMTFDFGKNHFNVIFLNKQLKLISSNGTIITIPGGNQKTLPEQTGQALDKFTGFLSGVNLPVSKRGVIHYGTRTQYLNENA